MDDNDFDRKQEREEDLEEDRFSTKLCLQELSGLKMQRCCAFLPVEDSLEILHGRLIGMLMELDAMVIRDLRPGRETLQTKQIVPCHNIHYLCSSASLEKCLACREYKEMLKDAKLDKPKTKRPKAEGGRLKAEAPKALKNKEKSGEKRSSKPAG